MFKTEVPSTSGRARLNLETPNQRIAVLGLVLAFLSVGLLVVGWWFAPLSDANAESFGFWLDGHSTAIWAFIAGAVPSLGTFLLGRRAGRKAGKTDAYNSAIATTLQKSTGDAAAHVLRNEAKAHGLKVSA